jgi:hypothetical protein
LHTVIVMVALATAAEQATAQQIPLMDKLSMHRTTQPYSIETFGEFRRLIQLGDFSANVSLSEAMAKKPAVGVGAVAGALGEITIYDGKLIVSYGRAGAHPDVQSESAALLSMGSPGEWQSVNVDRDVAPSEVELYLAAVAKAHGIDPEKSFPFEVQGTLISISMHVNAAPTGGPHGMGLPVAISVETRGDQIDGEVAGVYFSSDLEGIATHGGERTHAHWVSPDGASTDHLDRWGIRSGAFLLLPKPAL